jgi:hypothetical protein
MQASAGVLVASLFLIGVYLIKTGKRKEKEL